MKHFIKAAIVAAGLVAGAGQGHAQVNQNAVQKFAHLNSGDLLSVMPEMVTADAQYQAFYKTQQDMLQAMDTERQKKITTANEKQNTRSAANAATVDKELQALGTEIQELEQRIQDKGQQAEKDLKDKHDLLYQPIFTKAQNAIKAVAKKNGYAYVFDTNAQVQTLLYFDGGEDILPLVKAELGISLTAIPPAAPAAKPAAAPAKKP